MPIEFKKSETAKNLMRAYAGESQARNRYTIAAGVARGQKLHLLDHLFIFTANQEKEHAEIFYNYLKELNGSNLSIESAAYPINNSTSVAELLNSAAHNEYEEYETVYKSFSKIAKEEGFNEISYAFEQIGYIEKLHGDRFKKYAELMEKDMLFVSDRSEAWICLNCGHIHTGPKVPPICPVCKHDQGNFIRFSQAPYTE